MFPNVVTNSPVAAEETPAVRMETTIVEYYPGSFAKRFLIGYGSGHPSLAVACELIDSSSGAMICRFQGRRKYDSTWHGLDGDEDILRGNIADMAIDIADYLARAPKGEPLQ